MSFVMCPNFVRRQGDDLFEIRCKVCGTPIAGMVERVKDVRLGRDGGRIEQVEKRFTRFHNYTELKMVCGAGQFHVTNGCNKCLIAGLSPAQLNELMEADLDEQLDRLDYEYFVEMKARVPTGVVVIKPYGGIL